MLGLLGRNGAGKSTCMNVTMGLLPPRRGAVAVFGEPVTGLSPEMIAARGVALVPQGRRIFKSLTVRENLMVAARKPRRTAASTRRGPSTPCSRCSRGCRSARSQIAAHLSGGEQQMLAIGRALMGNPRVLLMDEPSEGLAPQIVAEVMATIRKLKESGLSIVLVEQNPKLVFDVADDIVILNTGRVAVVSTPAAARAKTASICASISGCSEFPHMRECRHCTGASRTGCAQRGMRNGESGTNTPTPRRASTASRDARRGRKRRPSTRTPMSPCRARPNSSSRISTSRPIPLAHFATPRPRRSTPSRKPTSARASTQLRRALRRHGRDGRRHAARHAAAAAALSHRARSNTRVPAARDDQRRHRRISSPSIRTASSRPAPCRCRTATRRPRSSSAA